MSERAMVSLWYRLARPLLNERGAVGDGGDGGDKKGGSDESVEQLRARAEAAEKRASELEGKVKESERELLSPEYLEFLDTRASGGKGKKDAEDDKGKGKSTEGGVDFEEMSKKEFAEYIQDLTRKELKALMEQLEERETKSRKEIGTAFAQVDLAIALRDNPDFDLEDEETKKAFYAKAKENPKWGASRVIKEVKRDWKETKEAEAKKKQEEEDKSRKALTERGSSPMGAHAGKELSEQEAGELAYQKAFGNAS